MERERFELDIYALQTLPITRRETEVLAYVAMGKTNPEIAIILGVSRLTVKKHLEHIFHSLGVETRTAAAGVALEVASPVPDRKR
jgi:DNA-binding CsgD family transcriptional regulator